LILLGLTARPVSAQNGFQFGRTANEPFSGKFRVVNKLPLSLSDQIAAAEHRLGASVHEHASDSGTSSTHHAVGKMRFPGVVDIHPVVSTAWKQARPILSEELQKFLNERDIGAGGFHPSFTVIRFAEQGELFTGVDGRGITLRYVLKDNSLSTRFRVPGPTPSSWDPGFQVGFDLELILDVEPSAGAMKVGPVRVKLNVHQPRGTNLTGDFAVAVNGLIKFLSGQDLIGKAIQTVNARDFKLVDSVKLELAKLVPELKKATKDAVIVPSFNKSRNEIVLTLMQDRPPVVR
jgi:hypothetical protein